MDITFLFRCAAACSSSTECMSLQSLDLRQLPHQHQIGTVDQIDVILILKDIIKVFNIRLAAVLKSAKRCSGVES